MNGLSESWFGSFHRMTTVVVVLLATPQGLASQESADAPKKPGVTVQVERLIVGGQDPRGFLSILAGRRRHFEFSRPYGIAWRGDDLLIADPGNRSVVRVDPRGRMRHSPEGSLRGPIGVASCPMGIVVSDSQSGKVLLLDEDLRTTRTLGESLARPTQVLCNNRAVFIVETGAHRIVTISLEGKMLTQFGRRGSDDGEFNYPVAAALAGDGLWVGDTLNFRVQQLDAQTGQHRGGFGRLGDSPGETPRIKGIAVDATGRLWITDALLDNVSLFSSAGNFLVEIGSAGIAPGQFSFPAGIAIHSDGRVAIADSLNRRVQVLRLVMPSEVRAQ